MPEQDPPPPPKRNTPAARETAARRRADELRAAKDEYVQELADRAPPLDPATLERIAYLLPPTQNPAPPAPPATAGPEPEEKPENPRKPPGNALARTRPPPTVENKKENKPAGGTRR